MAETGKRIIIGLFEIDKNGASMPTPAADARPDEQFELDSNGDIMPKDTGSD